ncbi:DNA helicase [Clostridium sp.]|uniref:DNA helicase n=1 Tax=Clostridium sp. TaxID=1506 RepID=UPI001DEA6F52|nr:DNA helicase [Clostridium sp.]MBS5306481.1 DNA helicase [Clostridium sp.]
MISEIKRIIENYLNNIKLCCMVIGTVTGNGIKLTDKLTIPLNFVTGNLKSTLSPGQKIRLLRNLGGQEFYILEVIE